MSGNDRPLDGCRVVVTRAEASRLDAQLETLGAHVVRVPTIAFVDPDDGGVALQGAIAELSRGTYDWMVVTSATTVRRLVAAPGGAAALGGARIAVVGPATARAVTDAGGIVALVAPEAVGESLVEAFPVGSGRVVQLRPEAARPVVAEGLRAKGWQVDEVAAYRTVAAEVDAATAAEVGRSDIVTFTSPSTVQHLVDAVGVDGLPTLVVSIGPVTSAALRALGIAVAAEADPHTVEGLVAAVVAATEVS